MHRFYKLEVIKMFFLRKMTKDATKAHFDKVLDFLQYLQFLKS